MRERFSVDPNRRLSYWVLKGAMRDFYVCTTSGRRDWRVALCVFDSEAGASEYLQSLGGPHAFVETMQRYGMQIPRWMLREPQLPVTRKTIIPELRRVAEGIGVECVALNPPPVEPPAARRSGVPELLPLERLEELSRRGDVGTSGPRQRRPCRYDRAS